jgi:hypothetical protein
MDDPQSTTTPPEPVTPSGTMELAGCLFEVAGITTDRNGRQCEIPGRYLRRVTREEIARQAKRSGQAANVPTAPQTPAPTASPPPQPTSPRRTARRPRPDYYRRLPRRPPPLVIHNEPASLSVWLCRVAVVIGAIVLLILYNWR